MTDDVKWGAEPGDATEAGPKLIPDEIPNVERMTIELEYLPLDEDLLSPPPTKDLIHSMNSFGLMQPIVIGVAEGSPLSPVYGGRRRVKAARALGWTEIAAWRVTSDDQAAIVETLTISLNATAKPNAAAELQSIERLIVEEGVNEKDVAAATGLKVGTIRARMRLMSLIPTLRKALEKSQLSTGNAEIAARLSVERQERLAELYEENGKITGKDVSEERRQKVQAATDAFDLDELDTPAAVGQPGTDHDEIPTKGGRVAGSAAGRIEISDDFDKPAVVMPFSPSDELLAAIDHLKGRAISAEAVARVKRAKWSMQDCEAVAVIAAALVDAGITNK